MIRTINDERLEKLLDQSANHKGDLFGIAFMSYASIPCAHFKPELAALPELLKDRITFHILDADENPTICGELDIHAVPMLLIFKDGVEIARYEGPYSKEALKERLETVLLFKKPDAQI